MAGEGLASPLSEAWCQAVPAQGQRTSLCQNQESGLAGPSREKGARGQEPQRIRQGWQGQRR